MKQIKELLSNLVFSDLIKQHSDRSLSPLQFIQDDELVEVTPESIRLRKKLLKEHERKRAGNAAKG